MTGSLKYGLFVNHFITKSRAYFCLFLVLFVIAGSCFAANTSQQAAWYRYYDKNGVANISSSVTPEHIRHGYEALDRNMQVIKRNNPYNATTDLKNSSQREALARQREQDLRLQRAYGNVRIATSKRDQILNNLKKQMNYQQQQFQQLQQDKIAYKRQEMEYHRKGQPIPSQLRNNLDNNAKNIDSVKKTLDGLRMAYQNTETDYANIIERLKILENNQTP